MLVGQSGGRMVNLPWPLALRSQLVPHKLTTIPTSVSSRHFFKFWEGRRNLPPPKGSSRRVKNTPWFHDYVHEVDKELFFTEQIQHVIADRTNCRVSVASVCLSVCLLRYIL